MQEDKKTFVISRIHDDYGEIIPALVSACIYFTVGYNGNDIHIEVEKINRSSDSFETTERIIKNLR